MKSRREFLKLGALAGAGLLMPGAGKFGRLLAASRANPLSPSTLTKFRDPLPFPVPVVQPVGRMNGGDYYEIAMTQFTQQLHSQLPPTTVWGYGDARNPVGSYPGPTFETSVNKKIFVKWMNRLPNTHVLPIDRTLHGTNNGEPDVRTVVHLHGGHVPPSADGHPDAWFTRNYAQTGPTFTTQIYEYPNKQDAATLWYHDHAIGATRLNVYMGLAGFWLLRDGKNYDLPTGNYEVPLVIQDRTFDVDGSLLYPAEGITSEHPVWVPEFFGDTILVNGKVWPYFEVEPRLYRFRILNGSNSRFYNLTLSNNQEFVQFGAEGGFYENPDWSRQILIAPGERAEVIINFAPYWGRNIRLLNDANTPFPDGAPVDANTSQIMEFRVTKPLSGTDRARIPTKLPKVKELKEQNVRYRNMALLEYKDGDGNPLRVSLNARMWDEPINTMPELGKTEVWNLINTTMDAHPMHLHLVQFQVLRRQKFNVAAYLAAWQPNPYPGSGPDPIDVTPFLIPGTVTWRKSNENGFKDTVRAMPDEVTTIIAKFDDYIGRYPWHCHILEHEDNEMMLQFEVIERNSPDGISEADVPLDNFPNPFNPETQIRFEMPITGDVELKIYNTLGQEVRSLAKETFTAGSHSILWDGLNNSGNPVASGTYIARLATAGITKNLKMVLLR